MNFSFSHSIFDLRESYGDHLEAALVNTAIHEAAHAITALALGHRVVSIAVWRDEAQSWRGRCTWIADSSSDEDQAMIASAGAAANWWMDSTLKRNDADPWDTCGADIEKLRSIDPDISDWAMEQCRRKADRLLASRLHDFRSLVEAILASDGTLNEIEISEILGLQAPAGAARSTPVATPLDAVLSMNGRTFDRAKVRALLISKGAQANKLEWLLNGLEAEARDRGMSVVNGSRSQTASTPMTYQHRRQGMRYGDPVGI